ncbi:lengsin [Xenopus tropicalis]|uniref:Lengsin n=1 Tax=Xenopus tropicalis TaxID=8364 RepID=A0A8J1JL30_XENTR|nr:lengsin [Xenopus tropicalis]
MANEFNVEDLYKTDYDEVDGSIISKIRRKRGVRVTGKYLPPLEWEKYDTSPSRRYLRWSHFDKDIDTDTENNKDAHNQRKEEKHTMDKQVESLQTNTSQICLEKTEDAKGISKYNFGKINDKLFLFGPAIPKETLEELKSISTERPLLSSDKCNIKYSPVITEIKLPQSYDMRTEKAGLTFETFTPTVQKSSQNMSIKNPDKKSLCEPIADHKSRELQKAEQVKQSFDGNQSQIQDKSSTAAGKQLNHIIPDIYGRRPTGSKDLHCGRMKIPGPLYINSNIEMIKQQIAREDIHFIRFEVADLHGFPRSKIIPERFFHEKAVSGIHVSRSYLEPNMNPIDSEADHKKAIYFNSDIVLKPDLSTFRVLPWAEKTGKVICDAYTIMGDSLLTYPRYLAKQLLMQLQESGFSLHASFNYEFCIFGVAETVDSKKVVFPAATLVTDNDQLFLQELFDGMYYIGGNIESFCSSSTPGQMEISFQPEYGLTAADNAFTFRAALKEVAKKYGYISSFCNDVGGIYNSGVFSHSLWDSSGTKNLFIDGNQIQELTDIGRKWLSGLLFHSAALSCLVAPGVSCRKHFAKGAKDPQESIGATYGFNDNSCSYNVKCHCSSGTYIENKLCSAAANPYLVLAATVAAGLDGIRRGLDLFIDTNRKFSPHQFKMHSVPMKMEDALSALKEDRYIRAALGDVFIHYFIAVKQHELETEEMDTERNKFLEYFI